MERRNLKEKSWKSSGLGISVYYKIKINHNKSEISLISLNKDIVEREMDLYFAYFANASEEFISKIKKIEIVHPKIKPIDEIVSTALNEKEDISSESLETITLNDSFENDNKKEIENHVKEEILLKAQDYSKNELFNQVVDLRSVDASQIKSQIEEIKLTNETIPKEQKEEIREIKIQNEPQEKINQNNNIEYEDKTEEIIKKYGFDKKEEEITPQYLELKNMIKMAQNEINSKPENDIQEETKQQINTKQNEEYANEMEKNLLLEFSKSDEQNQDIKENNNENELIEKADDVSENQEKYEEDYFKKNEANDIKNDFEETDLVFAKYKQPSNDENNDKNKEVLFDIFEKSNLCKEMHKLQNEEIERLQENIDKQNDLFNRTVMDELNNSRNPIIQKPTETELKEFAQNLDTAIQKSINNQEADEKNIQEAQYNTTSINLEETETKNNEINENNTNQNDDFKIFLAMYEAESIEDEFLICAYYIKNILSEQSFTMKSINAKLFKASEKIAGISILENLIEKGLIEQIQNSDINSYSITQEGEKYFENCFQR